MQLALHCNCTTSVIWVADPLIGYMRVTVELLTFSCVVCCTVLHSLRECVYVALLMSCTALCAKCESL